MKIEDYTRKYIKTGAVAHLMKPWNRLEALCGYWEYDILWRGTGSQNEYDTALKRRLCKPCLNAFKELQGESA